MEIRCPSVSFTGPAEFVQDLGGTGVEATPSLYTSARTKGEGKNLT